jgi:isopentenyl-diphosphate delta-isomerase
MIEKRKQEHVEICLTKKVQSKINYFGYVHLVHCALPEVNKSEINCSAEIFKYKLKAPIIITAITGGYAQAEKINSNLAQASEKLGIGFGVGSERIVVEQKEARKSFELVKNYNIPFVIANIGAPQLIDQKKSKALTLAEIQKIIDIVDANCLAIHLNFLQEVVQEEGETNAKNCFRAIEKIVSELNIPVILKETGAGISYELALKIKNLNVGIDVAGLGGTSFAAVEYYRAKTKLQKRLGKTFWNWGIPTPVAILNCKKAGIKPIVGSGGIRSGLDGAKAIALGSDVFGIALPVLKAAVRNANAVIDEMQIYIEELKSAMFLAGAKNLLELKRKKVILGSELADYL